MSAIAQTAKCKCGQVVFDLDGRAAGEILSCSWCGQKYRFAGGEQLTPLSAAEARTAEASLKTGRPARAAKSAPSAQRHTGPPGGILPMIGFIVGFNALAFLALSLLLPKSDEDGLRHAIWDNAFTISGKAFWPDVAALLMGHLVGFIAWALFAYRIHRRERLEKSEKVST